jgi:hypothetical protein
MDTPSTEAVHLVAPYPTSRMETGLGELLKKSEADRAIFQMWLKGAMSDPRNVAHDKKSRNTKRISLKAQRTFSSRKKTAREESHGAHKETDAEKAGGSIAEPQDGDGIWLEAGPEPFVLGKARMLQEIWGSKPQTFALRDR